MEALSRESLLPEQGEALIADTMLLPVAIDLKEVIGAEATDQTTAEATVMSADS